ncbi:hypothetical protein D3C86_1935930 [compost metagenome]
MLIEQRLQALLDGAAVDVQLPIAQRRTGDVQRWSLGRLDEALFKPLDHRDLGELQQPWFRRGVELMDVGQTL